MMGVHLLLFFLNCLFYIMDCKPVLIAIILHSSLAFFYASFL